MSVLICGSLAFDTIMVFRDHFRNHLLPDQLHILNVSFQVPEMRREFGGCAGNIGYNLKLLDGDPWIMATVGDDAGPYLERLRSLGLRLDWIRKVEGSYTAQCFITTDLDDNQITAFHPGAMEFSSRNSVADAPGVCLGIVSPDSRDGMLEHLAQFKTAGIPCLFDPGQGIPMFSGDELRSCLQLATWCSVNDYEARLLCEKTGLTRELLARQVEAFIVTRGARGSTIYFKDEVIEIPPVQPAVIKDPTGCGDAYRAGLLYGLERGWPWYKSGRLASLMGAIKISCFGAQNHAASRSEIAARFHELFGEQL